MSFDVFGEEYWQGWYVNAQAFTFGMTRRKIFQQATLAWRGSQARQLQNIDKLCMLQTQLPSHSMSSNALASHAISFKHAHKLIVNLQLQDFTILLEG